jgi:hypothetical protein
MTTINDFEANIMDQPPKSGIRAIDMESLQQRAEEGREHLARVLELYPESEASVLKAHADPFDTAIEAEVA